MFWNQFSEEKIQEIETQILSILKIPYKTFYTPVTFEGVEQKVWTLSMNTSSRKTPLILLHGFAAGICFWCKNLDYLAKDRPLYAIDLLGFGRSSRPTFSDDSLEIEKQMVQGIEAWRKAMNFDKFYLMGHSMGGYLATSYCITYPDCVQHLILGDPWGFSDHQNEKMPFWDRVVHKIKIMNGLPIVRAAGPIGNWLVQIGRTDISSFFKDSLEEPSAILKYLYYCNIQEPTGESAFWKMTWGLLWAKNPMIYRIENVDDRIPITFMYGANSWTEKSIGQMIRDLKPNSSVDIKVVEDSGHHIYSEGAEHFNKIIADACGASDVKNLQEASHLDNISAVKENNILC